MVHTEPRIVTLASCGPQPWRNGGGTTRELLAGPDAPAWQWRLSVADIATDGSFSAYPGVTRWFAVIEGEGVTLALPAGPRTLRPGDAPLAFDGADAPDCRLLAGPTRDLNLMLRGVGGRMEKAAAGTAWRPAAHGAGLYARVAGTLHADEARWALPAASLAWFDAAPAALHFVPADDARHVGWWVAAGDAGRER